MRSSSPSLFSLRLSKSGLLISLTVLLGLAMGHVLLIFSLFAIFIGVVSMVYTPPIAAAKYFLTLLFLESAKPLSGYHSRAFNRGFAKIALKPPSPRVQEVRWFARRYNNWASFLDMRSQTLLASKTSHEVLSPRSRKRVQAVGDLKECLQKFTCLIRRYNLNEQTADSKLIDLHGLYESRLDSICMNIGSDLSVFYNRYSDFFLYVSGALRHSYLRTGHDHLHQVALEIGKEIDRILSVFGESVIKCNPQRRSIGGNNGSAFQSFRSSSPVHFNLDPGVEQHSDHNDPNDASVHSDGTGYNNYADIDFYVREDSEVVASKCDLDQKVHGGPVV